MEMRIRRCSVSLNDSLRRSLQDTRRLPATRSVSVSAVGQRIASRRSLPTGHTGCGHTAGQAMRRAIDAGRRASIRVDADSRATWCYGWPGAAVHGTDGGANEDGRGGRAGAGAFPRGLACDLRHLPTRRPLSHAASERRFSGIAVGPVCGRHGTGHGDPKSTCAHRCPPRTVIVSTPSRHKT